MEPVVTVDGKQLHPMLHRTTGVKITSGGLSGWYDAPSTRTSYAAREKAAGVFSAPAYQDKRTIGVTGIVRGVDRSDLLAQQKMLSGLAPDPYVLYELRVDEDSSLMCRVQRSDATIFKPINDRTAQYTMEFTAPDPIRYAVTPQRRGVDLAAAAPSGLNFHSSTVLRRNASTNPALSVDDAGWHGDDGTGAAGARAAVSGFDRAYGFTVTAAADTVKINTGTVVLGQKQTWTLSASVSCSAADSLYVYAHFNDADGTYLGWVRNDSITVAADTVTRVAITAVAPTGAASGYLQAYFKDTAVGDVASMTMFLAEQADAAGEYFDGASSGASWEGTAGASASTLTGSALGLSFPLDFGSSGAANVMYLPNAGTADVLPLFTFASPVDQPVLTNLDNGARLEYLNSVGAGQTLTIDCKTKRVLLNGVSRRVDMGRADFDAFAVPANGVLRVAFGTLMYAISGAHVDATYRPGWW